LWNNFFASVPIKFRSAPMLGVLGVIVAPGRTRINGILGWLRIAEWLDSEIVGAILPS